MLPFQKRLTNSFYVLLGLPATAMGFGLSVQIAVLSWILTTKYGLDIHEVGLVWAAGPIAGILGQVIVGLISDRVWFWGGRRRPFILIGGILAALMIFALPRIDQINDLFGIGSLMAVAVTVALTLDLSINISFNPTRSIIADVTPQGPARTKGYTWMQSISNFFGSVAYLIGALIDNYFLIQVGIVLILLFSIVPMFFIEEPRKLKEEEEEEEEEGIRLKDQATVSNSALKPHSHSTPWGELMRLYIAHGFTWLGVQVMFVYAIAFIQQELHPTSDIHTGQIIGWSFFLLNAVGAFIPIILLEPMARRLGRVRTHFLMISIMALGYFGITFLARSEAIFYGLMVVLSFGWSSLVSLPFAIMTEKVNKDRMGFFMGIFNLSVVIPQLIASLVIGYFIKEAADKSLIFLISALSLSMSAVLWLFVKEPGRNNI
ncbi:MAG TPA: MFS transporter [Bacteroidales bacterium]|nr:MFS transporter [Bacteroidales bacterium]HRZ75892.1 MFS transporter [Bacteroidales bacterium]